jgi:hypothetical protein
MLRGYMTHSNRLSIINRTPFCDNCATAFTASDEEGEGTAKAKARRGVLLVSCTLVFRAALCVPHARQCLSWVNPVVAYVLLALALA